MKGIVVTSTKPKSEADWKSLLSRIDFMLSMHAPETFAFIAEDKKCPRPEPARPIEDYI